MEDQGEYKCKDIADRPETEPGEYRSSFISLDLTHYPELRDWLYERAKSEFRDVDKQIIWICNCRWTREFNKGLTEKGLR
jgi:hypothetical protein